MDFQERFEDDPIMVGKLMSILQAVINKEIVASDARGQIEDLLDKPEYNDLLQLLLHFVPVVEVNPPDNFSVDGDELENDENEVSLDEQPPSIGKVPSKSLDVQHTLRRQHFASQKYRRFSSE